MRESVINHADCYPFGMRMAGRYGSEDGAYRYGFQGQEMDDEVKGEGNSINYKYRMQDPRIGRFFAMDPLTSDYPQWSPYVFSGNRIMDMVEVDGLHPDPSLWLLEGMRRWFDAAFTAASFEVKMKKVTSTDIGKAQMGPATYRFYLSKESGLRIALDMSRVLDYYGNNDYHLPKGKYAPLKAGTYSEPSSINAEVDVKLPTQAPTNITYTDTKRTDGSKSKKVEASVGVNHGPLKAKGYVSKENSTNSSGKVSDFINIGAEISVPVYKEKKTTVSVGASVDVKIKQ